jgi:hypothetical protein
MKKYTNKRQRHTYKKRSNNISKKHIKKKLRRNKTKRKTFKRKSIRKKKFYKKRGGGDDDDLCPICSEYIDSNNEVILDCNHKFHKTCICEWLKEGTDNRPKGCPMCRGEIKEQDKLCPGLRRAQETRSQNRLPPNPNLDIYIPSAADTQQRRQTRSNAFGNFGVLGTNSGIDIPPAANTPQRRQTRSNAFGNFGVLGTNSGIDIPPASNTPQRRQTRSNAFGNFGVLGTNSGIDIPSASDTQQRTFPMEID